MSLKILITGDFTPINRIDRAIREGRSSDYFFNDLIPEIRECDFAITNLECPVGDQNSDPIEKTGPSLIGNPSSLIILKDAGFNLVTLANNHILDYGRSGLISTINALNEYGIEYVGAGLNVVEAGKTKRLTSKGKILSILNFTENEWSTTNSETAGAHGIDPLRNFYKISEAKSQSDIVLVITHGGHEMYDLPSPRMKLLFRFYIDSGADAVINHHTHCVSGFEEYMGKPIYYSLGNFLFDKGKFRNSIWNEGIAVILNFENSQVKHRRIPFSQCNDQPIIELFNGSKLGVFESKIKHLNEIISSDELLKLEFQKLCEYKRKSYEGNIEPYSNRYLHFLRNRNLFPGLYSRRKKQYLLNLIRCESHRDILIENLKTAVSSHS